MSNEAMGSGAALSPGILVTGSNRSGTTWVGEMLCHSGALRYVYEPFNPGLWPRWTATPLPHRNLYVCAENEGPWRGEVAAVLEGRRPILAQVGDVHRPRQAAKLVRDAHDRFRRRHDRRSTLLKDPIAIFSSPWLAERFGLAVVAMIRNPAAFASSIKRLEWGFDFRNWLDQELLMRDLLEPFEREVVAMVDRRHDLIDQAILLWRVHYGVIDRWRTEHPDWRFVRWEDLASAPVEGFRELYGDLGLSFHAAAGTQIASDNAPGNVTEVASHDTGTVRRDSRAAAGAWRHRLGVDEFARVRDGVADIAPHFYAPDEWSLEAAP
jgi:hypothetical protein